MRRIFVAPIPPSKRGSIASSIGESRANVVVVVIVVVVVVVVVVVFVVVVVVHLILLWCLKQNYDALSLTKCLETVRENMSKSSNIITKKLTSTIEISVYRNQALI